MLNPKNIDVEQKREEMSRPTRVGAPGRVKGPRNKLVIRVIKHYERVDALADNILQKLQGMRRVGYVILG